jgi:hypothetical protein
MCRPAAPALVKLRTVRAMLNAPPQPVSASTSSGRRTGVGDAADVDQHIVHAADGKIRHAERIGRQTSARQIDRAKAGGRSQARDIGVDGADHLQRPLLAHRGAQSRAGG